VLRERDVSVVLGTPRREVGARASCVLIFLALFGVLV
jgi:hypothetical protein